MLSVFYEHYEIEVTSFINRQGNTSYMLDVFDYSRGGAFAYRLIRYQWQGGTKYLICADSDGWCFPCDVCVKRLIPGFNWSYVRRALRERGYRFFSDYPFFPVLFAHPASPF